MRQIPADRNQRSRQVLEQPTESELGMRLIGDEGAVDRSEREPRQMVGVGALGIEPEDKPHLNPKPVEPKLTHPVDDSVDIALTV